MDSWWLDIRQAARSLFRAPGFTALVVAVLSLGIGLNAMMFSAVHSILLRKLPFVEPDRITYVESLRKQRPGTMSVSAPDFLDARREAKSITHLSSWSESQVYLTIGKDPERIVATLATSDLPGALGVRPLLGRWFSRDEEHPTRRFENIVLGYDLWQKRFGGDEAILGRTLRVSGRNRTVIGVMPQGFRFPETSDVFLTMWFDSTDGRGAHYLQVAGRLAPGASLGGANAELATMSGRLATQYPETNEGKTLRALPYSERLVRGVRPTMIILMLAVTFVLLIACANVANLLLARGTVRQRELAVRASLGASRARIVRQLLVESLLLGALGAVGGAVVANVSLRLLLSRIPVEFPFWMHFGIEGPTYVYLVVVSTLSAVTFGLAPALQATSGDLLAVVRDGSASTGETAVRRRSRHALVVAEIALSVVLLVGSGLMVRSFLRLQTLQNNMDARDVLTGFVTLPVAIYPDSAQRVTFMQEFRDALAGMPGVRSVSAVMNLHLGTSQWTMGLAREGVAEKQLSDRPEVGYNVILPRYFETMGMRLIRGRDFTDADALSPYVAIVNESAARLLWPGKDPIGRRFTNGEPGKSPWVTVVGVVVDVAQNAEERNVVAEVFMPHAYQNAQTMAFVIRADGPPGGIASAARRLLRERNADLPFYNVRTMPEHFRRATWEPRIYSTIMTIFATLALVIAGLGIYGVMAYSVTRRTREIGIRMALGADREEVQRMVMNQAMRLTVIGLGAGLAGAFALTRFMSSLLYQISPGDPPTFVGVAAILAVSALAAAWVPAHRATRVDPAIALRHD